MIVVTTTFSQLIEQNPTDIISESLRDSLNDHDVRFSWCRVDENFAGRTMDFKAHRGVGPGSTGVSVSIPCRMVIGTPRDGYAKSIEAMDACFGRVIRELQRRYPSERDLEATLC
jgi:hypothetical protein